VESTRLNRQTPTEVLSWTVYVSAPKWIVAITRFAEVHGWYLAGSLLEEIVGEQSVSTSRRCAPSGLND